MEPARRIWRRFRAGWRDTILLFREFRLALVLFVLIIAGSGWAYYALSALAGNPLDSIVEAMYVTLTLTFFQPAVAFPEQWYLQIFFFAMPVAGLIVLAHGLAEFGVLFFNRRSRGKEWEMAVASTYTNHIILIGLGHLGYRVVKELAGLEQDVVVVEIAAEPDLLKHVHAMGVPVIQDDGAREVTMDAAGVRRARSIILCTQNDSLNLRMALKARSMNPKIEVVIRIFDDEFADSLESQFGFHAMSATGMAAPVFAATAARINMTPPLSIEGQAHILANVPVGARSKLRGANIHTVEEKFRISVVMLCRNGQRQFHPAGEEVLQPGHTIAVLGEPDRITQLLHENRV